MAQGSDYGSNLVTRNVTPTSMTPAESLRSSLDNTPPEAGTPASGARTPAAAQVPSPLRWPTSFEILYFPTLTLNPKRLRNLNTLELKSDIP
jgi:hypothetical protein